MQPDSPSEAEPPAAPILPDTTEKIAAGSGTR